jgi:hypothetical protein
MTLERGDPLPSPCLKTETEVFGSEELSGMVAG